MELDKVRGLNVFEWLPSPRGGKCFVPRGWKAGAELLSEEQVGGRPVGFFSFDFFFLFEVCLYMCVHMWTCVYVTPLLMLCLWRPDADITTTTPQLLGIKFRASHVLGKHSTTKVYSSHFTLCFRWSLSLNLELTVQARLVGQPALQDLPISIPQHWSYRYSSQGWPGPGWPQVWSDLALATWVLGL